MIVGVEFNVIMCKCWEGLLVVMVPGHEITVGHQTFFKQMQVLSRHFCLLGHNVWIIVFIDLRYFPCL